MTATVARPSPSGAEPSAPVRPARRRYLWLALGLCSLLLATHANWDVPVAAWACSIFLIRFVRTSTLASAIRWSVAAGVLASLSFIGQSLLLVVEVLLIGIPSMTLIVAGPLLLDRLLATRLARTRPVLASLVYPVTRVAAEFLVSVVTGFGVVLGILGATQHGALPLIQVSAVTGVFGVSFLVAWAASAINHLWEHGSGRGGLRPVVVYASALGVVLALGGARLAFLAPSADTVRVAGISPSTSAVDQRDARVERVLGERSYEWFRYARADAPAIRRALAPVNDDLVASTEREARAGARLISWPETTAHVMQRDRGALLAEVGAIAKRYDAYVDVGAAVMTDHAPYVRNQAILVTPEGVAWDYDKAHPTPMEPMTPGAPEVPVADAGFARLAGVICYDADFTALMRQAGRAGADIMLVPSHDWRGFDNVHAEKAVFRSVENGYSMVRQSADGVATAYDYQGRTLARTSAFTTDPQAIVAFVPSEGVRTPYAVVGDLFAWLCVAGLAALVAGAIVRRRRESAHP
ncbi:MAG: hypothetical protein GEV10_18400 [Streptosporangiales bacterium]|nr:hypothetical protein [Streptosporangiales bacterium]